jgi:hypothetical protein
MQAAAVERQPLYDAHYSAKMTEANDIIATITQFLEGLIRNHATKSLVTTVHRNYWYAVIYKYNASARDGEIYGEKITSATIEDKLYSTTYLLSNAWRKLIKKYLPQEDVTVEKRFQNMVDRELNGGIDLETGNKYNVSVFWRKSGDNTFKNGIIITRNGRKYR